MAESVKRRVAAARLAVAFVAAGTIAGAAAWAQASPPPTANSSASDIFAKIGDIKGEFVDSANVDNGSLLYKDFKTGQVPSFKMFAKVDDAFFKYKKATNNFKYDVKNELGDVNGDLSTIKGELGSYIKMSDADARYIKMNDAIMGDGSVFTATKAIGKGSNGETLVDLPGLVKVEMTDLTMKITNTGGGTLTHASCNAPAGGGTIPGGELAPGGSLTCKTSEQTEAFQMINGDGKVVTLNFSNIVIPTGSQGTVQILIGL
jgi:hypothetical protein